MKTLYLALLIIAAGVIAYLLLTRKGPQYVVGPTQEQIDRFKSDSKRKTDSLTRSTQVLKAELKHDSTLRAQENRRTSKVIRSLKDRADSLLAQLNDSTPCCTASEIKSSIIALKSLTIEKLEGRIKNDSIFVAHLKGNFEYQIKNELAEKQLLKDEIALTDDKLKAKDSEIKRRKKASWIKNGIILGLVYLIVQTVD